MKKIISFTCLWLFAHSLGAQNVGIGTSEPNTKLHILGSLVVTEPTYGTAFLPTPAQTKVLVNATTLIIPATDSTGYIYDPGGSAGNYSAGQTAYIQANSQFNSRGIEISFSDMDLNIGDSLIITDFSGSTNPTFLAVGNGNNNTSKIIINAVNFYIVFKSNGDANVGRGFALKFRRLYSLPTPVPDIMGLTQNGMYYDVKRLAFRTGRILHSTTGAYSFAGGFNAVASGVVSFAFGDNAQALNFESNAIGRQATASGSNATAIGYNAIAVGTNSLALGSFTNANGDYSTAMGNGTTAGGESSTCMGQGTQASGIVSTAMGYNSSAVGPYSTAVGYGAYSTGATAMAIGNYVQATASSSFALGNYASTNGQYGSMVIGDNSTNVYLNSATPNGFRARFAAGYGFYTSANLSTGVWLAAGGNAWMTISDRRLKENFLPVNGEGILKSIAAMPQYTWNYKTQDPKTFRHYGPMAQDFYKAFGKDELGIIGCDSMINQHDFLGVNFIAIQALVVRSDKLEAENLILKNKLSMIEQKLDEME